MAFVKLSRWGRCARFFVGAASSADPSGLSDGDLKVERQTTTARLVVGAADSSGAYATSAERAKFNCDGTNPPTCEALRMQDQTSGSYYRLTVTGAAVNLAAL